MSKIYDALKKLEATRVASPPTRSAPFDPIRLEQFMDLQQGLLLATPDRSEVPDRLVHAIAAFLGVAGAAVGVLQQGSYRLVAACGAGYEARAYQPLLGEPELAALQSGGQPLVIRNRPGGTGPATEVLLPLRGGVAGALHVAVPEGSTITDETVQLARLLAGLVGPTLAAATAGAVVPAR
jgi:hypothetical protein